jgi:hypothetical protein
MAVGSGLSASFGIATETTVGTPVAVTRFFEFDSESMAMKKHTAQGAGLRSGGLVQRAARRSNIAREVQGDVNFAPTTNGFGLLLTHMLGSYSTTPTSIGSGLYQQIHNVGPLAGKSFTTQIVKPDTTGTLAPQAFTYPGCKVTSWELAVAQGQELKLKVGIDALDEATPSNAFAATTLAAAVTAGATSLSTTATIPAGSWIVVGNGVTAEVVQTTAVSGSGPFTVTLAAAIKLNQASGAYVGSATNVNYGAAASLQTASYTAGTGLFGFHEGKLIAGGTTATTSGLYTNTGGTAVANVRSVTVKGSNAVKVDRWGLGSSVRSEQLDNGWRQYSIDVQVEYNGRAFYDAYATDAPLALQLSFTDVSGAKLSVYAPVGFLGDSGPKVAGPDILMQQITFTVLDDGTNGALQVVYTSTDVAL